MALFECPECGGKVSDKATICPHCGCPIEQPQSHGKVCPECGAKAMIHDAKCINCGYPFAKLVEDANMVNNKTYKRDKNPYMNSIVTILGYTESFAATPSVKIFKDGIQVGEVRQNGKFEINVNERCELEFKCNFRSTRCNVSGGDWVLLSFNRITGALQSTITDKDNYQIAINESRVKDGNRWIWIIIFVLFCFFLAWLI